MNGYEEKIKDRLFLEVCNAAGREEWDGLAHQQKENLMLVCRLSGYDEKFQRDCGLVTREQMEHSKIITDRVAGDLEGIVFFEDLHQLSGR